MNYNTFIIVSANYPPHYGGVDRYSYELAQELLSRKKRVIIVTSAINGLPQEEGDENYRIYRLPTKWFLNDRMPVMIPGKCWKKIKNHLKSEERPFVIVQTFLYSLSLFAARFCHQMGWPVLLISHGSNYVCQGHAMIDKIEHLYEKMMSKRIASYSDIIGSVSDLSASWWRKFGMTPQWILPNGINSNEIDKALNEETESFRDKLAVSRETTLVAFVGRMIKEKGIIQIVEVIDDLRSAGYDIMLVAAGDGPLLEQLNQEKREGTSILGRITHNEVLRMYRECDCHCLPSDSEGFSTTVLEAAYCGCYNIIAPHNGAVSLISDRNYGYVMKDNSKGEIKKALLYFMNNRDLCRHAAAKCKVKTSTQYTWSCVCDQLLDYSSFINEIKPIAAV